MRPRSIQSFDDFITLFLWYFSSSKRYPPTPLSLFNLIQKLQELLWKYIQRFNPTVLAIPSATLEILIGAFARGLWDEDSFHSVSKNHPWDYNELLACAKKYINMKGAQKAHSKLHGSWLIEISERLPKHRPPSQAMSLKYQPYPTLLCVTNEQAMHIYIRSNNCWRGPWVLIRGHRPTGGYILFFPSRIWAWYLQL